MAEVVARLLFCEGLLLIVFQVDVLCNDGENETK